MITYRIHGDNVVECERIAAIIIHAASPMAVKTFLMSPSTIVRELTFEYDGKRHEWRLELLPGFNKARRHRWRGDIFCALKENGSFLDETPDVIITRVAADNKERILCAIEFCSALQAGNQAWQRSGRAFSTGRAGCPYLYIVDFVKYELEPSTRARKSLRFPNPAVPYSYINFSRITGNFIAQLYVKSEEFDKRRERLLFSFDENDFASEELATYLLKSMLGLNTQAEEETILRKNLNVVLFLASSASPERNFTHEEWEYLYDASKNRIEDIVDFATRRNRFNFHKTITSKGHHGESPSVIKLVDKLSVGLASRDLPLGIIPADKRRAFSAGLKSIYPCFDSAVLDKIAEDKKHLILCIFKGFKPRGDDNRPDRGLLPLAAMISENDVDIMTYLYGPILSSNYHLLMRDPSRLAQGNGLWKSILGLSNFVAIDAPLLHPASDTAALVDTTALKNSHPSVAAAARSLTRPLFSSCPSEYHEDDVDAGVHYLFAHLLKDRCFEGMCNPPGGDWSGFSIIDGNVEKRWLSLPRVSDDIDGKRPDHIVELFGIFSKPILLSIESKERSADLEPDVGTGLITYIRSLVSFVPSVERRIFPVVSDWQRATATVELDQFEMISAAAYLRSTAQASKGVFSNSHCEMLFIMAPRADGWEIEIISSTSRTRQLGDALKCAVNAIPDTQVHIVVTS